MLPRHKSKRVAAYIKLLKQVDASDELISRFQCIVEIDENIAADSDDLESLDRLLFDVCRQFNFTKPFEQDGKRRWIRPHLLPSDSENHCSDTPQWEGDFDPKIEQAYRRGYDQGFKQAQIMLGQKLEPKKLIEKEKEIYKWRMSKLLLGSTPPGQSEPFGIRISIRSSIPAGKRFNIFKRDNYRCKICGRSADDGITLHIDHITPVNGEGSDDETNLQTLCEECNLGKSDKPMR